MQSTDVYPTMAEVVHLTVAQFLHNPIFKTKDSQCSFIKELVSNFSTVFKIIYVNAMIIAIRNMGETALKIIPNILLNGKTIRGVTKMVIPTMVNDMGSEE
jgi:hypothetical protein